MSVLQLRKRHRNTSSPRAVVLFQHHASFLRHSSDPSLTATLCSFILYLYFYPRSHKFVRSLPLEPSAIPKRPHLLAFFRTSTPSNLIRRESATSISSQTSDATSNSSFDPRAFPLPGAIARHAHVTLSPEYRLALSLFVITILHLLLSTIMTFVLLLTLPRSSVEGDAGREHPSERAVRIWALILGISSAVCGIGQYLPQLILTFSTRLVGSLSIPMMLLQVGSVVAAVVEGADAAVIDAGSRKFLIRLYPRYASRSRLDDLGNSTSAFPPLPTQN